jgi:flagellar biogenesis protein FliO
MPKGPIEPGGPPGKPGAWTYTQPDWPEPANHQGMFLRLGLGTLVVLGLCAGTIFVCKRWLSGPAPSAKTNGQLHLIETLALGQRCWMHLVHVGTQSVLVGGDASGVKTIVPLSESFATTLLETSVAGEASAGQPMATILAQRFSTPIDPKGERG